MWLNYEEDEGLLNQRFLQRAKARGIPEAALRRLHIRNMAGDEHGQWPLFGPPNRGKQSGLYNSRPERLPGWDALVKSLEHIARVEGEYPTLIVIDPALSAFVGDPNSVGPVREFTGALGALAKSRRCGILLLAHATKEGSISPFDRRQVGGSGAWTDGLRCAMTITHGEGSGVPGTLVRSFAVLKANSGPNLWTTVKPIFANGTSGRMIGFERRQPFEWYAKDLWLSDADERKKHRNERRQKAAKPNGAGPRANGGEPDSSAPLGPIIDRERK